ncbi:L,D-transpeptidase [Patescibacteria group bacterium]
MKKWILIVILCCFSLILSSTAPDSQKYIRINVHESKMYVYQGEKLLKKFVVALHPEKTTKGTYRVNLVVKNPWWKPPRTYQALGYPAVHIPPGPNNPVKWYWIGLDVWQDEWIKAEIGIHGSLKVEGYNSMGCIRMKKDDIYWLKKQYKIKKMTIVYIE